MQASATEVESIVASTIGLSRDKIALVLPPRWRFSAGLLGAMAAVGVAPSGGSAMASSIACAATSALCSAADCGEASSDFVAELFVFYFDDGLNGQHAMYARFQREVNLISGDDIELELLAARQVRQAREAS